MTEFEGRIVTQDGGKTSTEKRLSAHKREVIHYGFAWGLPCLFSAGLGHMKVRKVVM